MACPFVEQVRAIRHGIAYLAAEQVVHRPAERPALQIQASYFVRRHHASQRLGRTRPAGQAVRVRRIHPADDGRDPGSQPVEVEHVQPGQRVRGAAYQLQVRQVAVRLTQPDQAVAGVYLDDRPQRPWFVYAR
jgi:hypothetical protein